MHRNYTAEMQFVHELSRSAGSELMKHFGSSANQRYKADRSLVTDADLASEKLILEAIKKAFPSDNILSEEAGLASAHKGKGTFIWIVDPLDGTTNFANSYPFFCVSIARGVLDEAGNIQVVLGAVHDPIRDKTYVAERGKGAWQNGSRIAVCPDRAPEDAFLVTGFAYHKGENLKRDIEFFMSIAQTCQSIRRDGAAALDLALVAEGVYDGYWESGIRAWDVAAGVLLVEEAGGEVRNFVPAQSGVFNIEVGDVVCGTISSVKFISGLIKRD